MTKNFFAFPFRSARWRLPLLALLLASYTSITSGQDKIDGASSAQFASSPFRLEPIWATQVDERWRPGHGGGTEDDGVTAEFVEFSPDGKHLVTGNGLGKAMILSAADGAVERTLTYITKEEISLEKEFDISGGRMKGMEVECGAFTPDGGFLVLGGNLNGVKVFDLHDGSLAFHFHDEKEEVDGLGISPDGRFLGHAAPHACQVRSLLDWTPVVRVNHGNQGVVNSVHFAQDSSLMASAGNFGHVIVTRTSDWSQVGDGLASETSSIKSVRISPDLRYVAAGYSSTEAMVVWNITDMTMVKHFPLFYIEAVAWSTGGRYVLAGGRDDQGRLRVYRTSDWELVANPIVQADRSNIEYIDVHGKLVAIAGEDAHVRLFRVIRPAP